MQPLSLGSWCCCECSRARARAHSQYVRIPRAKQAPACSPTFWRVYTSSASSAWIMVPVSAQCLPHTYTHAHAHILTHFFTHIHACVSPAALVAQQKLGHPSFCRWQILLVNFCTLLKLPSTKGVGRRVRKHAGDRLATDYKTQIIPSNIAASSHEQ